MAHLENNDCVYISFEYHLRRIIVEQKKLNAISLFKNDGYFGNGFLSFWEGTPKNYLP